MGIEGAVGSLSVDLVTAEVVSAMRAAGVPVVLLKGPSIARWLYAEDGERGYVDTDLLVPAAQVAAARRVLLGLGYSDELAGAPQAASDGVVWTRGGRDAVDLHLSLPGLDRLPVEAAWSVLVRRPETIRLAGVEVSVLGPVARLMHLALHAAKSGIDAPKATEDLRRGLELVPVERWQEAAALAAECDATAVFAAGLRLVPRGAELADRLALPRRAPAEYALRSHRRPPLAIAMAILSSLPGWRPRLRYVRAKLWPSAVDLAWRYPYATRGRPALAAARLVWWGRILRRLPAGYLSWRRAAREASRGPGG